MDSKINKLILDYDNDALKHFVISERDLLPKIEQKVNTFLKKGGLNIILITGLRGTGKTTILKTIAKQHDDIYTSGDFLKTNSIDIKDITQLVKSEGKRIVIIDEIIYLQDWPIKLKIDSDSNQNILYLISGSSAMQLSELSQDISRRLDIYKIKPLSFREFLRIKHNIILEKQEKISELIFGEKSREKIFIELNKIKNTLPENINALFKEYYDLQFPFLINEFDTRHKLIQMVEKIIYKDLTQIENILSQHLKDADLIVKFLTTNEKTSYLNISNNLGIGKDLVSKIILLLEKADLISILPDIIPTRELRGNKKIVFTAPSIRLALNQVNREEVTGFAREDMFVSIVKSIGFDVAYNYKQNGFDFLAANQKFEIGHKKKNIQPNTFVISDSLDVDFNKEKRTIYLPQYLFALIN